MWLRYDPMSELQAVLDRVRGALPDVGLTVAVQLAVVVLATWLALRLSRVLVRSLVRLAFERETTDGTAQELSAVEIRKRSDTLAGLFGDVLRVVVLVVAFLTVLATLRIDIGPALAGLGVVAVALGLGGNLVIRDYLNGAFVLLENQYGIGDTVSIGGVSGKVEHFSLRRTTLRDIDGIVHVVPNGQIGVTSNLTRIWAAIHLDVQVALGTDVARAMAVIDEAGRVFAADEEWRSRVFEAPRAVRVDQIGEFGITLKILGSVKAADRWVAAGEMCRRILEAFASAEIDVPRPQRVILARPEAGAEPGRSPESASSSSDAPTGGSKPGGET